MRADGAVPDAIQSARDAGLRYVHADGPGITRRRKGKGFLYLDADHRPIRGREALARIEALVIPPAWENVWISPRENTHIQAVGWDARGRKQYRYHARYREVRDRTKFDKLLAFGAVLPRIRRQVKKDLAQTGFKKRHILAAVVSLLDQTCIRIGNEEYARANGSYGLTTLHSDHATVHGGTIRLRFKGKSGREHEIVLHDPRLARLVKRIQDLPGEELFQYQTESGEFASLNSADVNDYLREISKAEITAKDFRTWHGTQHALAQLAEIGPASSDTEAKRNIMTAVKATALKLGNRPATCRCYYIHPAVFRCYSDGTLFEIMGWHNPSHRALHPEAAVIHLVESAGALLEAS